MALTGVNDTKTVAIVRKKLKRVRDQEKVSGSCKRDSEIVRKTQIVKSPLTAPFFGRHSIDSCLNLSTMATSLQRPDSSVPKTAVVESFGCSSCQKR